MRRCRHHLAQPSSPPRRPRSRSLLVSLALLALVLAAPLLPASGGRALAAAGQTAPATPAAAAPASATPTATDLLARASQRLAETESVRFDLTVDGRTFLDPGGQILLLEAEGRLLRPDRVSTSFKAEVLGQVVTLDLITVGDTSWTTNLLTGAWEVAPPEFAYRPSILFDNQDGIGPVMGRVTDAERLEDDEIDGKETYRVRAVVDESVIAPLTYSTMSGSPVTVDLWIDRETDDLLRAQLAEPENDPDRAIWIFDISEHGDEVTIEPPV